MLTVLRRRPAIWTLHSLNAYNSSMPFGVGASFDSLFWFLPPLFRAKLTPRLQTVFSSLVLVELIHRPYSITSGTVFCIHVVSRGE